MSKRSTPTFRYFLAETCLLRSERSTMRAICFRLLPCAKFHAASYPSERVCPRESIWSVINVDAIFTIFRCGMQENRITTRDPHLTCFVTQHCYLIIPYFSTSVRDSFLARAYKTLRLQLVSFSFAHHERISAHHLAKSRNKYSAHMRFRSSRVLRELA